MTPYFDDDVCHWVAARAPGCEHGFHNSRSMGVEHNGNIVAGVVFHNWSPESGAVEISCAATDRRWMTRNVMRTAFGYVFDGLGCQIAAARTSENNKTVRKLWKAMGASEYVIPRLRGVNEAEAILTLTKETWLGSKFMKGGSHGEISTQAD